MPPRYAYWTILIDNAPTAFRAKEQADLLPTLAQLRRTNKEVVLKWFAHGHVWDSPEAALRARQPKGETERRGRDWRPGGQHQDPRARFDKPKHKKPHSDRPQSAWADQDRRADRSRPPDQRNQRRDERPVMHGDRRPPIGKGGRPPRRDRPADQRSAQRFDQRPAPPWSDRRRDGQSGTRQNKPGLPAAGGAPRSSRPAWARERSRDDRATFQPKGERPPRGANQGGDRPFDRSKGGGGPWRPKPKFAGGPHRPASGGKPPWQKRPKPPNPRPPASRDDDNLDRRKRGSKKPDDTGHE